MNEISEEIADANMLPEYDFSGGVQGKYAADYAQDSNIVVLDPDVAVFFPNAKAVNETLRLLIKLAQQSVSKPAGS